MELEIKNLAIITLLYLRRLKMLFFPKGTYNSQNSRKEALTIADNEYAKIFKFCFIGYEVMTKQR